MNWKQPICLAAFAAFSLLPLGGHAKETAPASCLSQGWPQEQSDLKPDSSLSFGALKNGLRYVIMPNHEPKGRVSLQLDVQSGSLDETEKQRGLAHYLEHMMFNGTRHYPPGTMVEYFQSIGMGFGPDTNAQTSYDATVYQMMMPDSKKETLSKGLQLLADYAGGALLLPKEVNKERGVILSEKRDRDSAGRRVWVADLEQAFAGTLIARRDVIGVEEVLNTADAALLRQYYERWYRPDNMMLVAVGDADPAVLKELIEQQFSPLKAQKDQPACPDLGKVAEDGSEAFYQHEPDLGRTDVTIGSVWNLPPQPFTQAEALRQFKEYAAATMLNNRLQRLVNSADSPLTSASFYADRIFQHFGFAVLKARTDAAKWQPALALLDSTLRQALSAGFAEAELARAQKEILSMLHKHVKEAGSRKSDNLTADIIGTLNADEVFLSPQQELDMYAPVLKQLTLTEVNDAFRSLWHERRLVKVAGTAEVSGQKGQKPEAVILAAYKAADAAELKPWEQAQKAVFPYLPRPAAQAKVAQHTVYDKIGAERYVFSNGLTLNLKKTDFEPNELRVAVMFGKGQLSQPKPGLALLANLLIPESGVGKLDKEQLKAALAQYSSRVNFQVGQDSFQFQGQGLRSETEVLFQLLHTYLHDPAFRSDAFARVQRQTEQFYAQMQRAVEGMMQLKGDPFLAGGNPRYGLVPLETLKALTLAEVQDWLRPVLKHEPLEISVVGDFDKDQVLKLVGTYFGEERKGAQQAEGEQITFPAGKNLTLKVPTATMDKALVTVAWPTADFWDIKRTRRLNILASILDDRLRKQIREDLGATYSPDVYNQSSTVDPGYGVLRSIITVKPGQTELLAGKIKQAGADLAKGKVTQDELHRALEPMLTSIRDMMRNNRYWLEAVLIDSSRHPKRLEWPLTILSDFAAIKTEELNKLAGQYLQPDKAAEVILLPKKE